MSGGRLFNAADDDADFDAEFDTKVEEEPASSTGSEVDDLVDEVSAEQEELDEEMSEADRRLSLAGYYKTLAKGGVFNDGTEEAAIVDQELKDFARERMRVLLNLPGMAPVKVELPFTEEQVAALLSMANRIIERQGGAPPTAAPAVRPSPLPPKPVKPAGPQIKPLSVPQALKRAPAGTPAKKPTAKATKKPMTKPKVTKHTPENTEMGEVFEEKGKKYKFVPHPDTGEPLKLNVSNNRQARHPGALPMPTEQQMVGLSEQMSTQAVNSNPAMKSNILITAAALSQMNSGEE